MKFNKQKKEKKFYKLTFKYYLISYAPILVPQTPQNLAFIGILLPQ